MQRQKFQRVTYAALTFFLFVLALASTASAAEYKVLYRFQGGTDGDHPGSDLIFDAAGNLYGTTSYGGAFGYGSVFKLTPNPDGSWSRSIIYSFSLTNGDGGVPYAGLTWDTVGNLFGTTSQGGANGGTTGTVFKLTPNPDGSWSESVIHSFDGGDGALPRAGLIFDAASNLYGTTSGGGVSGSGAVFRLTPNPDGSWSESVLYSFRSGGRDGALPRAGLTWDAAGNLYGTTSTGGTYGRGTAFKLTPNPDGSWTRSKLHAFKGPDGANPVAGLIFDAAGKLYGTTANGGAYGYGTAFKLVPKPDGSWTSTKLHDFKGTDGANPVAGLIFDAAGNLYGTAGAGGMGNHGLVFRITP